MSADTVQLDFLHYLTCDLPLGYPLKTPITKLLSPAQQSISRRELLHQQAAFLDFSTQYLETQPWLAYLAAVKHEAVLIAIPTFAAQLVDVVDKFFYSDLEQKSKELREAARAAIDDATALDCERLVLLQTESPQIEDARKNFAGAINAGFSCLEPLPLPPPDPPERPASLPYFAVAAVVCVIAGFLIPPVDGGMAWSLLGLIVTGLIAWRVLGKERHVVRTKGAEFKAYMLHESFHALCRKSVALVLALPLETRKTALIDLPACLAMLVALPPEREALEARYIRPFFT
jgi:hypothetical protein